MCEPRITELVSEIRDLYAQQCDYAAQIQSKRESADRKLMAACRARAHSTLPELEHFEDIFSCQEALARARQDPQVRLRSQVAQTFNWIAVVGACMAVMLYSGSTFATLLVAVSLGAGLVIIERRVLLPHLQRSLREQLVECGVPICLACGYDLRGQIMPRCPECGTPCAPSLLKSEQEDRRVNGPAHHAS